MQDVKVTEDQEATFVCELDKDTSDVTWLKNGKKIEEDDTKFEVQRKGRRHSLIVKDIGLDDAAAYTCVVGRKESSASLIVEGNHYWISSKLLDVKPEAAFSLITKVVKYRNQFYCQLSAISQTETQSYEHKFNVHHVNDE